MPIRPTDSPTALAISPDKVCHVIVRAREFEAEDVAAEPDPGPNASHEHMVSIPDHADDLAAAELKTFIDDLSEGEQVELVALAWLGRGSRDIDELGNLRRKARRAHSSHTAGYLLGMPFLPEYLDEGLSLLGYACGLRIPPSRPTTAGR